MTDDTTSRTDFAPTDLTDGRSSGDWKTRYPKEARVRIWMETGYLLLFLFSIPIALLIWYPTPEEAGVLPPISPRNRLIVAWLGGTFGGTLFAMKWLYHSVAKCVWNADRLLWRIFTPHLSGALAFAFFVLMVSGILDMFNNDAWHGGEAIFGFSFLVGYFSDTALGKLAEVARTLFGSTR